MMAAECAVSSVVLASGGLDGQVGLVEPNHYR